VIQTTQTQERYCIQCNRTGKRLGPKYSLQATIHDLNGDALEIQDGKATCMQPNQETEGQPEPISCKTANIPVELVVSCRVDDGLLEIPTLNTHVVCGIVGIWVLQRIRSHNIVSQKCGPHSASIQCPLETRQDKFIWSQTKRQHVWSPQSSDV
jgi:hypothetical protein